MLHEWRACQLDTPNWLEELTTIPNAGDPKELAQKIQASFKIPGVRCDILGNHKEYTVPPAPKCVKQGMFLPDDMPYQDVQLKSLQSTLTYAQALQYWAKKANLPVPSEPHLLAMSIHKLRWQMRRYTTFHDCDVFEGLVHRLPAVEVKEAPKPNPVKPPLAEGPTIPTAIPVTLESTSVILSTSQVMLEEYLVNPISRGSSRSFHFFQSG